MIAASADFASENAGLPPKVADPEGPVHGCARFFDRAMDWRVEKSLQIHWRQVCRVGKAFFFTSGILPSALRASFAVRMRSCACSGSFFLLAPSMALDPSGPALPFARAPARAVTLIKRNELAKGESLALKSCDGQPTSSASHTKRTTP